MILKKKIEGVKNRDIAHFEDLYFSFKIRHISSLNSFYFSKILIFVKDMVLHLECTFKREHETQRLTLTGLQEST